MIPILVAGSCCSGIRLALVNDLEEKYNAGDISKLMDYFAEDVFFEVTGLLVAKGKEDIQDMIESLHTLDSHIHFSGLRVRDGAIVGEVAESNLWLVKSGLGKGSFSFRLGMTGKQIDSIQMKMSPETHGDYARVLGEFQNWLSSEQGLGSHGMIAGGKTPRRLKDSPDWLAIFPIWLDVRFGANEKSKDFADVMDIIGVKVGMIIADIGAGDGIYSFRLANRVGKSGKIYATEIDKKWLAIIKERSQREGISNVFTVLGGETDARLPEEKFDMIFLRHTLHCMSKPGEWLENLYSHIHHDARLVIIDGDPDVMGYGWEYENKKEEVIRLAEKAGFELERMGTFLLPEDYIYIFRPRSQPALEGKQSVKGLTPSADKKSKPLNK